MHFKQEWVIITVNLVKLDRIQSTKEKYIERALDSVCCKGKNNVIN